MGTDPVQSCGCLAPLLGINPLHWDYDAVVWLQLCALCSTAGISALLGSIVTLVKLQKHRNIWKGIEGDQVGNCRLKCYAWQGGKGHKNSV